MVDLQIDMSEFNRTARSIGGAVDQVPFALSVALNEAAQLTRQHLITETWPRSVTVRNHNFMRAALRIEFSTKANLRVSIFDSLGRAHLKLHAEGGTKQARGRLAIPTSRVVRGASGVAQAQRPRNLPGAVLKGNLLFRKVGRGKSSKLQLMYKLAASASLRKDVPFREDFATVMRHGVTKAFPTAMHRAMATRRA